MGARSALVPDAAVSAAPVVVSARDVEKRFGRLEVLKGVTLDVRRGETVCIIGPSGSGKSTFLRCINHLEKIDAGRLWVDGSLVGYRQQGDKLYELRESEVAREVADKVVFMDDGVVVEEGPPAELLAKPRHERTRAFLSKVL